MKHVLYLLMGLALAGTGRAEELPRVEWTPAEVRAWFEAFAKKAPDGERGIRYNGSDETHHWFTVPPGGEYASMRIQVRRSELELAHEGSLLVDDHGAPFAWSHVDPSRDFAWVPKIGPEAPETRSLDERVAALEAYMQPSAPDKAAADPSAGLTERAERDIAFRLPDATKIQQELSFPQEGVAQYAVVYTLPGRRTRWVQAIHFFHREGVWHRFWNTESRMIVPDPPTDPADAESEARRIPEEATR